MRHRLLRALRSLRRRFGPPAPGRCLLCHGPVAPEARTCAECDRALIW